MSDKYYQGPNFKECERRFAEKVKNGLVHMSFTPGNMEGATVESVCAEIIRLDDAMARGEGKPFCFNDSRKKAAAQPLKDSE